MVTEPPKEKVEEKKPPLAPKPEKKTTPSVEALQEQLANKNIELQSLEEKYQTSSREGEKIPKLIKDIEDLKAELRDNTPSDTPLKDEDLLVKYPNFNDLEDYEKEQIRTAERALIMAKSTEAARVKTEQDRIKKEEKDNFDKGFNEILINPNYSDDLKDKKDDFKEFCYGEDNLGKDIESLAKSFLYDLTKEKDKDKDKKNRDGLESPSGGGPVEPVKEGYTLAEVDDMIKNDPEKHRRLLEEGKLKIIEDKESNPEVGE